MTMETSFETMLALLHYKTKLLSLSVLKVQSCRLYNNKYVIDSTQITNTETLILLAVLVF